MSGLPPEAGEMARRIREHDWGATPLGPIETWPQSLTAATRLLINTGHPMVIWWGPDLIQLYNDAYRQTMGPETHPAALGGHGRETWAEIWDVIGPRVESVMRGEGPTSRENQLVPVTRHGRREDAWWTYGFSPIEEETAPGGIGGVLIVCTQTTRQVLAERRLSAMAERQRRLLDQARGAICILSGPDHVYEFVNEAYVHLAGGRDLIGRTAREAMPDVAGQGIYERLDEVYATGRRYRAERVPIRLSRSPDAPAEERFLDFVYQPTTDEAGRVSGIFVEGHDVTPLHEARQALRASEARFRMLAESIEDVFYLTDLDSGALLYLSPAYERIWGRPVAELMADLPSFVETIHPGDHAAFRQGKEAQERGEPVAVEYRVVRPDGSIRWVFDRSFPIPGGPGRRSAGIATDITARKRAADALRDSEERLRLVVETVRDYAIFLSDRDDRVTDWPPGAAAVFGWSAAEIVGQPGALLFTPEDRRAGEAEKEIATARDRGAAPNVRWHLRKDGSRVFIEGSVTALRDPAGRLQGFFKIGRDVTERRAAEERLRESEERFRRFGEASPDILWIRDADTLEYEYVSPAFEEVYGERIDWVLGGDSLERWASLILPEDAQDALAAIDRVRAGERVVHEFRIRRPADGQVRVIRNTDFPLLDEAGEVRRIGGIGQDMTEGRQAARSLKRSERRQRALIEGIPQLVWRAVDGGNWIWASPQWSGYTGQPEEASHAHGWLAPLHPDDRDAALAAWREAQGTGAFEADHRIRHAPDGRYRWFQTRAAPLRDEEGRITEWLGTSTDIDDLRGLQEHQRLLLAELQHRVRNTLGVIRSIARRTAQTSDSVDSYAAHLDGRLNAFGRVQAAVTRDPAAGVDLAQIVADELAAWTAHEGRAVRIDGPPLRLQPKAAETFALALHELATNAVKHGALSAPQARIDVTWSIREEGAGPELVFAWIESGVALPEGEPRRRGFGTDLLERTLAYELKAKVTREFARTGLRCTIVLPLTDQVLKDGAERPAGERGQGSREGAYGAGKSASV